MLPKRPFYILFFLFSFLGYVNLEEDSSTVLCIGPPKLVFEVIANNANVFENNTYSVEDITLMGTDSDEFSLSIGNIKQDMKKLYLSYWKIPIGNLRSMSLL